MTRGLVSMCCFSQARTWMFRALRCERYSVEMPLVVSLILADELGEGFTELLGLETTLGVSVCLAAEKLVAAATCFSGLADLLPREKPPPTGLLELSDFTPNEKLLAGGFSTAVSDLPPNEKAGAALLLEDSDLLPNEKPEEAEEVFPVLSAGLAPNENPPDSGFSVVALDPKEKAGPGDFSPLA